MTFITTQEAAKLLNCSTRSIYRKIDSIDTFDNLVNKGFAKRELTPNGNNRRLFSKDWLNSTFSKNDKPRQSKINSLDVKAFDIFEKQLEIKDNQIESLQENLNIALHRIAELQKYFHLNGIEKGPTLIPTRKYLEEHPESTLNFNPNDTAEDYTLENTAEENLNDISENKEKTMSDWLKTFR